MAGLNESLSYAKGDESSARKVSVTVSELPSYKDVEIKKIREELNLTQKNFAFVLGVSPKTVEAWCILEHWVELAKVSSVTSDSVVVGFNNLRKLKGREVASLLTDERIYALNFRRINKGALHTGRVATVEEQHVASSYKLVCSRTVEYGA